MMLAITGMALAILAARAGIRSLSIFTAARFSILPGTAAAIGLIGRLRILASLLLGGHDDTIVMLGVLEIALSRHDVARG